MSNTPSRCILPPCFRLILTFSYCLYDFLREQELEIGGSHITDMTESFHRQIRLDRQDVRELWAVRPHAVFVMMMYTLCRRRTLRGDLALCGLHEFLRLNVTDIRDFWNSFYISISVGYDCYEFFRGDSFPVGCSCWTN